MSNVGIYKITSPSGKVYVGQSRSYLKRISRYRISDCKKQNRLYSSILKHGWASHAVQMIHELPKDVSQDVLNAYEVLYIQAYKECKISMLNLRDGGGSSGGHSLETRQKLKTIDCATRFKKGNNSFLGKKHKPASIIAMSESAKRRKPTFLGKYHSEEVKKAQRERMKGRPSPRKGNITSFTRQAIGKRSRLSGNFLRKKVICSATGLIFDNVKNAALHLGIKRTTLNSYLSGQNKNKTTLNYYQNA